MDTVSPGSAARSDRRAAGGRAGRRRPPVAQAAQQRGAQPGAWRKARRSCATRSKAFPRASRCTTRKTAWWSATRPTRGVYGGGKGARELAGTPQPLIAQNALAAERPAAGSTPDEARNGSRRSSSAGAARPGQCASSRRVDGRWLHGRWVRSRDGGIVSTFTDVTELRRAQDAYGQAGGGGKTGARHAAGGDRFPRRTRHRALQPAPGADAGLRTRRAERPVLAHAVSRRTRSGARPAKATALLRGGAVHEGEMKLRRKDGAVL